MIPQKTRGMDSAHYCPLCLVLFAFTPSQVYMLQPPETYVQFFHIHGFLDQVPPSLMEVLRPGSQVCGQKEV